MTSIRLTGQVVRLEFKDDDPHKIVATLKFNEAQSMMFQGSPLKALWLFDDILILVPGEIHLGQEFVAEVQFVNPEHDRT